MDELMKKQLFYFRIMGASALGMLILIAVCLVIVVPKVLNTVEQVNTVLAEISTTLEVAEESIGKLAEMSDTVKTMSGNMNSFVENNANQVSEVMGNIEHIDFEGLNDAIKDLGDVVKPLAQFFSVFKK